MAFKIPKLFASGTKAKADDVNENFAAIETEINDALAPGLFESGDLKPSARENPPSGWLLCDGSAVSRSTYKDLFEAIGTKFGVGDGATTFNVPDLRGRVPMGVDGAAGRITGSDALGNSGGSESLPAHTHDFSGNTSSGGSHSHSVGRYNFGAIGAGVANYARLAPHDGVDYSSGSAGSHSHSFSGITGSTGSGSHGVKQPYLTVNWFVKV